MEMRQIPVSVIYKTDTGDSESKVTINATGTIPLAKAPGNIPAASIRLLIAETALSTIQRQVLSDLYRLLVPMNFLPDARSRLEMADEELLNATYPDNQTLPGFEFFPATSTTNAPGTILYNLLRHPEDSNYGYRVLGGILQFLLNKNVFKTPYWRLSEQHVIAIQERDEEDRLLRAAIPETDREQLVNARRGQGYFRIQVEKIESACRLTQTADKRFLVASHIKPWRLSNNAERLDGHNGLLLSPHADYLFDKGWISFSDDGTILRATESVKSLMIQWGLDPRSNAGRFSERQRQYLAFHREHIFKIQHVDGADASKR